MSRLRGLAGLCLTGYGLLVVLRVVAHEALLAGLASLGLGVALLGWAAWSPRERDGPHTHPPTPPNPSAATGLPAGRPRSPNLGPRGPWVAGLGLLVLAAVLGYNLVLASDLAGPEWGLILYGAGLVAAAPLLGSESHGEAVATAVGWSFPLLLAPLLLYAIQAFLHGPAGLGTADLAAPLIHYALTLPTAGLLAATGTATDVLANNLILETSRGTLTLGVGLVCAGIYPTVLFMGILGLHGWRENLRPARLAGYLAAGLVGLYLANLTRLVLLAKIGQAWGGARLQQAHAHLGWILFVGFILAFWGLVLRHFESPSQT